MNEIIKPPVTKSINARVIKGERLAPLVLPTTAPFQELKEVFSGINHLPWTEIVLEENNMRIEFYRYWEDFDIQVFDIQIIPDTEDPESWKEGSSYFTLFSHGQLSVNSPNELIPGLNNGKSRGHTESERAEEIEQSQLIVDFIKSKLPPQESPKP